MTLETFYIFLTGFILGILVRSSLKDERKGYMLVLMAKKLYMREIK